MKNIIKAIIISFVIITSCDKDPDNVVYTVLEAEQGAVLRTITINNAILNSSQPNSEFSVLVEEQDVENGALMESVDITVTLRDLTPENGTTIVNNAYVKTIEPETFSIGPVGLLRGTINVTYGEAFAAMGIATEDVAPGDVFIIELNLNLTDGRTFGPNDVGTSVTGGFFNSPFKYNALITCSPQPGIYTIDMHDSFGDGWQTTTGNGGDGIHVNIDGNITVVGMCSSGGGSNIGTEMDENQGVCTPNDGYNASTTITIPEGTNSATWTFPGDRYGEISFEIYGTQGQLLLAVGLGEGVAGLLPVTECAQ